MIVLIINGAPRTGKDTFIELLRETTGTHVGEYSSIDWVKDLASNAFGWDGIKDAKSRKLLSDLKDIATKWNDIPFKEICEEIRRHNSLKVFSYFCTNIREPKEIVKLVRWCKDQGISCYSVWIRRLSAEIAASEIAENHADTEYMNYCYDYVIRNDGTLGEYEKRIQGVVKLINEKEVMR